MSSPPRSEKRALEDAEDAPVVKRGRGRPRKYPPKAPKDPNAPKRGRGRPRKNPEAPPPPTPDPDAPKRGRGRPKKEAVASDEPTASKPRGRPRKDGAASTDTAPSVSPKKRKGQKNDLMLSSAIGTYDIICEKVDRMLPGTADDLYMTITAFPDNDAALVASFDLGIVEGTMLLAADEVTLEAVRKQIEWRSAGKGEKCVSKSTALKDRSLHFVWRGKDVTSEPIKLYAGLTTRQTGVLKFKNDKCLSFQAQGDFPEMVNLAFAGIRGDEHIECEPEPWDNFDETQQQPAGR